jgi:hypothetical protein
MSSTDCADWSCTLTSKEATGDYSVKVVLDGDVVFEKSGTLLGTKKFEQGLALAGTGDHDIKVTCSIKVGDDVVKDVSEKTLHCGKGGPTPTPTPPPPPTPTPTPVSEVKGVEVLPTTGEVATLGLSTPMMLRALGVLLMTSGGLLGWLNRGNSDPGSGSDGPGAGDPPSGHRPPSRQRLTHRRNGSGPRRSDPWQP